MEREYISGLMEGGTKDDITKIKKRGSVYTIG